MSSVYSRLESVSPELILSIMKLLPTFHDLNSLIRTSIFFGLVFKSNQYGVCEAIARSHFRDVWDDIHRLLHYQRRIGQLCHAEPSIPIPIPSPTGDDKEQHHKHDHGKCGRKPGMGIFEGGAKIGLAEAKKLLRFTKRSMKWRGLVARHIFMDYPWEYVNHGIPVSDIPIPDTCSITTQEALRIDQAIIRYYLLILACVPDWIDERKKYNLLFPHHGLFSKVITPVPDDERAALTQQELLDRKRRRAELFLQYQKQDLRDMYVVCKATAGCSSHLPGTIAQGADHAWEQWTNIDDACVQQEAELHIKRIWRKLGMDCAFLMDPDLFFEKVKD